MKNDSLSIRLYGRFQPYLVLTARSIIESAVFFTLFFALKTFAGFFGFPTLYVAVPAFLILFAVVIPLRFGTVLFFLNREQSSESQIRDLFVFLSPGLFFEALKNGLVLFMFSLLCFLTFFLPCISIFALMCYNIFYLSSVLLSAFFFAAFLLLLASGIAAWVKVKKLTFLSRYIFVLTPQKSGLVSLFESAEILSGRTSLVGSVKKKNCFSRLFCAFVFPVGYIIKRCNERNSRLAYELLKERK